MSRVTSFFILLLLFPTAALANNEYVLLAPLPGMENVSADSDLLNTYFSNIYQIGVSLVLVLAVAVLIFGGIQYMMTDSFTKKGEARDTIVAAVVGILLAVGSYAILTLIIGDRATSLDFGLEAFDSVGWVEIQESCEVTLRQTTLATIRRNGYDEPPYRTKRPICPDFVINRLLQPVGEVEGSLTASEVIKLIEDNVGGYFGEEGELPIYCYRPPAVANGPRSFFRITETGPHSCLSTIYATRGSHSVAVDDEQPFVPDNEDGHVGLSYRSRLNPQTLSMEVSIDNVTWDQDLIGSLEIHTYVYRGSQSSNDIINDHPLTGRIWTLNSPGTTEGNIGFAAPLEVYPQILRLEARGENSETLLVREISLPAREIGETSNQ